MQDKYKHTKTTFMFALTTLILNCRLTKLIHIKIKQKGEWQFFSSFSPLLLKPKQLIYSRRNTVAEGEGLQNFFR